MREDSSNLIFGAAAAVTVSFEGSIEQLAEILASAFVINSFAMTIDETHHAEKSGPQKPLDSRRG
jgi:hypothetical protein